MKNFMNIITGIAFVITAIILLLFCFGWLFNCDTSRLLEALKYSSFSYLVIWFINLMTPNN